MQSSNVSLRFAASGILPLFERWLPSGSPGQLEIEPGRFRARIKRSDKRKIHIVATDEKKDDLTTGGQAAFSAQAAIDLAKQAIDGGGMN